MSQRKFNCFADFLFLSVQSTNIAEMSHHTNSMTSSWHYLWRHELRYLYAMSGFSSALNIVMEHWNACARQPNWMASKVHGQLLTRYWKWEVIWGHKQWPVNPVGHIKITGHSSWNVEPTMAVNWSIASKNWPITSGIDWIRFTSSWAWRYSFRRFLISSFYSFKISHFYDS